MVETYIMKIQVNVPTMVPTPKFVPTGGFVSKRNFLHNRPQGDREVWQEFSHGKMTSSARKTESKLHGHPVYT